MLLSSFGFLKREFIGSNQMGRPLEAREQYKYNEYTPFTQQGTTTTTKRYDCQPPNWKAADILKIA